MLESINSNILEYQKLSKDEMQRRGILGRLVGVCASFIAPTRNGRKYPEQLWENVFNNPIMKERIENGVCYGELGHPADREETDMTKIAVCLAEVPKKGEDGKLRAVFDILNTPNGKILKSLCDYGSTLGVSSRGSGDLETDFDGNESVNPDTYNCEGFDIVLIPAVKEARLEYVTESLNKTRYRKTLRDKLTESINKEDENNQKIMRESLSTLGIDLNESRYVPPINFTDDDLRIACDAIARRAKSYFGDQPYTTEGIIDIFSRINDDYDDYWSRGLRTVEDEKAFLNKLLNALKDYGIDNVVDNTFVESLDEDTLNKVPDKYLGKVFVRKDFDGTSYTKVAEKNGDIYTLQLLVSPGSDEVIHEYKLNSDDMTLFDDVDVLNEGLKQLGDAGSLSESYNFMAKPFDYKWHWHGKEDEAKEIHSAVIVIPDALKGPGGLMDATIYPEDENGNVVDIKSMEDAQNWIDKYGNDVYLEVMHGNEIHAIPNNQIIDDESLNESLEKTRHRKSLRDKLTESLSYDEIKKNAIKAAKRDGYNQIITIDKDGNYGITRDYPDNNFEDFGETQVAKVKVSYKDGVQQINIEESLIEDTKYSNPDSVKSMYKDAEIEEKDGKFYCLNKSFNSLKNAKIYIDMQEKSGKLNESTSDGWREVDWGWLKDNMPERAYKVLDAITSSNFSQVYTNDLGQYKYSDEYDDYISDSWEDFVKDCEYAANPWSDEDLSELDEGLSVSAGKVPDTLLNKAIKLFNEAPGDYGDTLTFVKDFFSQYSLSDQKQIASYINKRISESLNEEQIGRDEIIQDKKSSEVLNDTGDEKIIIEEQEDINIAVGDTEADELYECLKQIKELENQVTILQEKLSVGHAKELRLQEEVENYKSKVSKISDLSKENKVLSEKLSGKIDSETKLNESIETQTKANDKLSEAIKFRDNKIKKLTEELTQSMSESKSQKADIEELSEKYETARKDLSQLREQHSKKLEQHNQVVEKYQRIAKNAVNKYIDLQATILGVKPNEIKSRLSESYSFKDIDSVCEDLREYKLNVSTLPFNTTKVLNEGISLKVNNVNRGIGPKNEADELTDYDLKLMEAYK